MDSKWAIRGLIAILIAAFGGFLVYRYMDDKVDRLENELLVATTTLKATNRALDTQDAALAEAKSKYKAVQEQLHDAIKNNPDWATGRVPDAVYDSLFGTR